MAKKNGFARQIVEWKNAYSKATKDTYIQYLTDTMVIVLNNRGFGEKRIREILTEWGAEFDKYFDALTDSPEADYAQQRLDARIMDICKSGEFIPFEKRYEFLPEIKYDIR